MKLTFLPVLLVLASGCATDKATREAAESGFVNVHGGRLYYERSGHGTPLLLISGGGINRSVEDFRSCIPELSRQFDVIAVDSPGQGKSASVDTLSYRILTDMISEFIDSLRVDSLYVMGWSDGGIAGIMLAAENPKVRKVIAVGPNNGKAGFDVPANIPVETLAPPPAEYFEQHNRDAIANYMKTPGRDWRKMTTLLGAMWYASKYFPDSTYSRIRIPVMIVLGDRDDISVAHGNEMAKSISNSQFCVLPNTSHEVFKERPELITPIAVDFFRAVPGADQESGSPAPD